MFKYILPTFLFILVSFSYSPTILFAAPFYSVAPLVIDEKLEGRDIVTRKITLTNNGTQPVTVYPSVNNIAIDEGGTIQEFLPPVMSDRTTSLSSWIEITRSGVNLPIGESKTLDLTLRIHPTPKPGVYHALIGFGTGRNQDEAKAMVQKGQAPGTIITVSIEDKKIELLKMSRFYINRFVTNSDNQAARYTIKNSGDDAMIPTGEILFYNNRGIEVGELAVNANAVSILPGEEQEFTTDVPVAGFFGKYKAVLNVVYGKSQGASLQDTVFFYVLPLKMTLIIFGIFLVIIILLALYIHRRYYDGVQDEDADTLMVHIRESVSPSREHDIDLNKK